MSRSSSRSKSDPIQLSLFEDAATPPKVADAKPPAGRTVRSQAISVEARDRDVEERLLGLLADRLPEPILSVTWTRNRTRIVSARAARSGAHRGPTGLDLRLHRCFMTAPDEVLLAVGDFLGSRDKRGRAEPLAKIREHFRLHGQGEETAAPPQLRPEGEHFHLGVLRDRVNREYFEGHLRVDITWGRRAGSPRRRRRGSFSIRLGSYDDRFKLIRIHPVLDRADVPEMVLESIIYHEMLHAVVPPRQGKSRRSVHPPEFRRLERLFAHFDAAEAWLEANIERLSKLR